jgi:PLP dependent protein
MNISENINNFRRQIEPAARLIAVSKTKPVEVLKEAYEGGQRLFGENKVQEMTAKYEELPKDIEWHLIGHLQSNKVKYMAPFVSLIHSIDSLKLLEEVNKQALKNNRVIDCLLQVFIAQEETKFGLDYEEAEGLLNSSGLKNMQNIRITGLMGMATFTENKGQIRSEFKELKQFFEQVKTNIQQPNVDFRELSMGMSGDWQIAWEEGSTLVRIGSAIFGSR